MQSFLAFKHAATLLAVLGVGYVVLIRSLRFRRTKSLPARYGYDEAKRATWARMNVEHAWAIQQELAQLEFPALMYMALQFALVKTFGIPSISRTLVKSNQLSSNEFASKRGADTGVLMSEILLNAPSSTRTVDALGRMNQLHDPYQRSGLISNDDLLYTLSLFVFEPMRWVNKYEWRRFSDFEVCARGCQWKAVGDAMGIDDSILRSGKKGWQDGLQWAQELEEWSEAYEAACMKPAESNKLVTEQAVMLLLSQLPEGLQGRASPCIDELFGKRLRAAIMHDEPPAWAGTLIRYTFRARQLMLRHLSLPRFSFLRVDYISQNPDPKTKRHYWLNYTAEPWYVFPTLQERWGVKGWARWAMGKSLPGDKGAHYHPQGYHIHELGPRPLSTNEIPGKEAAGMILNQAGSRGCPFAMLRS